MGIRRYVESKLETIGETFVNDPSELGYTKAELNEIIRRAEGSIDQGELLGASYETAPLEMLRDDETLQYLVVGDDFQINGDGSDVEGGAGWVMITDKRSVFMTYSGAKRYNNSIPHSKVNTVEKKESLNFDRLTLRATSRTYSIRTTRPKLEDSEFHRGAEYIRKQQE